MAYGLLEYEEAHAMKSVTAEALNLRYEPVSVVLTDEKPDNAVEFKKGKFGCVMALLSAAAR